MKKYAWRPVSSKGGVVLSALETRPSFYSGQFMSDWKELKAKDKSRPAYDPELDGSATRAESGIREDGTLSKFTASSQYHNWPVNRCQIKQHTTVHLDYNDIHPAEQDFWDAVLENEGLGTDMDSLPSTEFNAITDHVSYCENPDQSMTGIVCDRLMLATTDRNKVGSISLSSQYKTWLDAVKRAKYLNEVDALKQTLPVGQGKGKGKKGVNKRQMLLEQARQRKALKASIC